MEILCVKMETEVQLSLIAVEHTMQRILGIVVVYPCARNESVAT